MKLAGYAEPHRNLFFFFLATLVKIRDDKQLLSDFKVLLDVDFVSGGCTCTPHPSYDGSCGADLQCVSWPEDGSG